MKTLNELTRSESYFDQDDDCHWYCLPLGSEKEFEDWIAWGLKIWGHNNDEYFDENYRIKSEYSWSGTDFEKYMIGCDPKNFKFND